MKIHLASAAVIGVMAAALALPTPSIAAGPTNNAGTSYNPNFGSSGNGSSQDTGTKSHMSANGGNNFGSSGNANSKNTNLKSHESTNAAPKQQ